MLNAELQWNWLLSRGIVLHALHGVLHGTAALMH